MQTMEARARALSLDLERRIGLMAAVAEISGSPSLLPALNGSGYELHWAFGDPDAPEASVVVYVDGTNPYRTVMLKVAGDVMLADGTIRRAVCGEDLFSSAIGVTDEWLLAVLSLAAQYIEATIQ